MNECPRAEGKEFFRLLNKFDGHQFIGLQEEAEILVLVQTDKKQFGTARQTDRLHRRLVIAKNVFEVLKLPGDIQHSVGGRCSATTTHHHYSSKTTTVHILPTSIHCVHCIGLAISTPHTHR